MMQRAVLILTALVVTTPIAAQVRQQVPSYTSEPQEEQQPGVQQQPLTPLNDNQAGRIVTSAVGEVGQRQTRESAAAEAGIKPMARIANRINNRVQNRIRNRIDRTYDPQANATDPFVVAEDQARTSGRPR